MKNIAWKASLIFAVLVSFAFFACSNPVDGAYDGMPGGSSVSIDLSGMDVAALMSAIDSKFSEYDNVTLTGTGSGIDDQIELDIPANKTLTWKADYTSSGTMGYLIELTGAGNFVMANGGKIESSTVRIMDLIRGFTGTIIIEPGAIIKSVNSTSGARCIYVLGGGTVIVKGGTIEALTYAITTGGASNASVFIESGNISGNSSYYSIIVGGNSTLAIRGGVFTNSSGGAIVSLESSAKVYVAGSPSIADNKIVRQSSAVGYYTGDHLAKFNTTTPNHFTVNTNLFEEETAPAWAVRN